MITEDEVYDTIEDTLNYMGKYELAVVKKELMKFDEDKQEIRDYILYNAYRITKEIDVRVIICFTENGYSSAKIASLNPEIPVITFTKSNDTYRFLSLVW